MSSRDHKTLLDNLKEFKRDWYILSPTEFRKIKALSREREKKPPL